MVKYIQIENTQEYVERLTPLWISYMREIYKGDMEVENATDDEIASWLIGRVQIQGQKDTMHFELIFNNDILVGFVMYAIDLGGIKGIIEPGYGYIMELYIMPDFRRKGIATKVFVHIQDTLKNQGARRMYLTPDSASGVPFWQGVGFSDCGKIDPDNKMPIYLKDISES